MEIKKDAIEKKKEDVQNAKDSGSNLKGDFIRTFLFYFSIIIVLSAIAYLLAVLPNLFVKSNPQSQNPSNLQNFSQANQVSNYGEQVVCKESMTEKSRFYNVKYKFVNNLNDPSNYVEGYIEFKTVKNKTNDKTEYIRTIDYKLDYSKLLSEIESNKNISSNMSAYYKQIIDSLSGISMKYLYNADFTCKDAYYSFTIGNQTYTENSSCIPPDIPFQICKENLKEMKSYELNLSSGSYNVTEYLLKAETDVNSIQSISNPSLTPSTSTLSQDVYLTFSDLPFPITMNSSDSYMELVSYSKIE